MKALIGLAFLSGLAFLLFLVFLIRGFAKKSQPLQRTALLFFMFFIGLSGWTVARVVSKSYHRVTETFRPRTGVEIYDALFGKRQTDCVTVLHFQDQVVPKIDYAIWLHIKTCPQELERLLQLHPFSSELVSTKDWRADGPLANDNWFNPAALGDSIRVFRYHKDEYGNGQYIYASLDSTVVFVKDVVD